MRRFKRTYLGFTVASFLLLNGFANETEASYNEIGSKANITTVEQLPKVEETQWIMYPSAENVSLNKVWTIKAKTKFKQKYVEGAVIVIDDELIPVTIDGFDTKELTLKATHNLPGGKSGELRIYLSNGKNYKVPFTTKDEPREVTAQSSMQQGIPILKDEKITAVANRQKSNYYEVTVKEAGELTILLNNEQLNTNVYKIEDGGAVYLRSYETDALKRSIFVTPGKYLVYIANLSGAEQESYTMTTTFEELAAVSDQAGNDAANALVMQDEQQYEETLHVYANDEYDEVDMYQLSIDEKGSTSFDIQNFGSNYITVELLDEQQTIVERFYVSDEKTYAKYLPVGNYFVKITAPNQQTRYTIEKAFKEITLTAAEQQRLDELLAKWQQWQPTHEGEQAIDYSTSAPYAIGEAHPAALTDALNVTKMLRFTTGLSTDVTLNETYNERAQAASLVNFLNGSLSHYPEQPANLPNDIYKLGYAGASNSNIGMGYMTIVDSLIKGYMSDDDQSNISRVGHRRWILSPHLPEVGFGYVDRLTAMYVIGDDYPRQIPYYDTITWPAKNVMPTQFFGANDPWSISFNPDHYKANISDLTVLFTVNGETTELTKQNTEDFYLDKDNYGFTPLTLIFRANDVTPFVYGDRVKVEVQGLTDNNGNAKSFSYETIFLELE